jgi:hypothetical protein
MVKEKTLAQLQELVEFSNNVKRSLDTAIRNLDIMSEIETTRDTAMVRTKIDEAIMWLEKYQGSVIVEQARRTCK